MLELAFAWLVLLSSISWNNKTIRSEISKFDPSLHQMSFRAKLAYLLHIFSHLLFRSIWFCNGNICLRWHACIFHNRLYRRHKCTGDMNMVVYNASRFKRFIFAGNENIWLTSQHWTLWEHAPKVSFLCPLIALVFRIPVTFRKLSNHCIHCTALIMIMNHCCLNTLNWVFQMLHSKLYMGNAKFCQSPIKIPVGSRLRKRSFCVTEANFLMKFTFLVMLNVYSIVVLKTRQVITLKPLNVQSR